MWLLIWSATALATQSIELDLVHSVHAPKTPELILTVNVAAHDLTVDVACGAVAVRHNGAASAGETVRIPIGVPAGQHACGGTLDARFADGTTGSMPLSFSVAVQEPIALRVTMEDLSLDRGQLRVHVNQPIAQLDVDVFGETGSKVAAATRGATSRTPVLIEWPPTTEPVTRIAVTATGPSGLSTALDLFPWSYAIPHDDVIFPSGSAEIPSTEEYKLEAAKREIDATLARFAGDGAAIHIPMKLFVAGFTDTVGNRVANQRLSEARARAIAQWFLSSGFNRDVFIQGFGERGLAIQTPDETDAPANRRAEYIIAAEQPMVDGLPIGQWTSLR